MIKKLLEKIKIEVEIELVRGYEKEIRIYRQQLLKYLIQECDQSTRRTREEIHRRDNISNIKFYGYYSLEQKGLLQSRSINKVIRVVDVREEEDQYIVKKFGHKLDFIDNEARNAFQMNKVTTPIIKYTYGINPYGVRNSMINNQMCGSECL